MTPNLLDELEGVVRLMDVANAADIFDTFDAVDDFQAAAVNFLRTHAPALADMVRKAARYDYLSRRIYIEDHDGGWSSSYRFLPMPRHDGSTYNGATPYNFVTLDDAIDHAIAQHSGREG